ncbi:MAG TPA: nitronate monooxygenase [Gemmatimonadales bacterium]|jgi:nitronate monooxygenase
MVTDLPVIQAPMAGSQGSALVIAVSNAGGLGSLPCALLTPDAIHDELSAITSATSKPYNVNFFVHREPPVDEEREAAWRAVLAPYYRELGANPADIPLKAARTGFDHAIAAILETFRPPMVSFHFGLPEPSLVRRVQAWGAKVIASATTVAEARHLEAHGVDAVIAQGLEAGGHRGMFLTDDLSTQIGTLALVRQLVLAVRLPVIAAGGIADAAGVRAALALGAGAVQVGTAYLACPEAKTSAVHRAALKGPGSAVTALTNLFTGRPARGVVNRLMREIGPMNPAAPAFPLASGAIAPLRAKAEAKGSGDFTGLWAGQYVRRAADQPAARLTRELAGVV